MNEIVLAQIYLTQSFMMDQVYPFEWNENSKEDQDLRVKFWTGHNSIGVQTVTSTPLGVSMPLAFKKNEVGKKIWNMSVRPDDIWIVTYPKSGTTMSQELLWQMSRGCDVTSDESKAQLFTRSPFLGFGGLVGPCEETNKNQPRPPFMEDAVAYAETLPSPRIIKSHLPISMLPPKVLETSKVIVMARNVKDACVSFYHHEKLLPHHAYTGTFESYVEFYMKGEVAYGNYWTHIKVRTKNIYRHQG